MEHNHICLILFAKRISAEIAKNTFLKFEVNGLTTLDDILTADFGQLVKILDSGGYARYDSSTATKLLEIMKKLKERYGTLERLHTKSKSPRDLEKRLQEFKGIGPVGVTIFLRELRGIWKKAKPAPSPMAVLTAQRIGLNIEDVERYEPQLVRLNLEYCRKHRSADCPLANNCVDK